MPSFVPLWDTDCPLLLLEGFQFLLYVFGLAATQVLIILENETRISVKTHFRICMIQLSQPVHLLHFFVGYNPCSVELFLGDLRFLLCSLGVFFRSLGFLGFLLCSLLGSLGSVLGSLGFFLCLPGLLFCSLDFVLESLGTRVDQQVEQQNIALPIKLVLGPPRRLGASSPSRKVSEVAFVAASRRVSNCGSSCWFSPARNWFDVVANY